LTDARVAAAGRLIRRGVRFPLDLPLDLPAATFFEREALRHEVFPILEHVLDDRLDNFYPQASTQWDGFGHFAHSRRGFFGGRTAAEVRAAPGVRACADRGIVG